jgi:ribose-phosphate pyrophosphokinase
MRPLILPLPGNDALGAALAAGLDAELGTLTLRRFPDRESYVRIETPAGGRDVVLVCTLDRPDDKLLPLLFLAATAKDLGSLRVGLVAPYLAYMRQDRRFNPGEGVTSAYFAEMISEAVDWAVTVDPHLHRRTTLGEVYPIPTTVVHAAPRLAEWIANEVSLPLLVGPDEESRQWVEAVAASAGAPAITLRKVRRGDREVEVSVPEVDRWPGRTPVLVDDIISTARTMIGTIGHLRRPGMVPPVCVGVHAVFADRAYDELRAAGAARIVTTNSIPHPSNVIDLGPDLTQAAERHLVSRSQARP